jgi:hypothetical protein
VGGQLSVALSNGVAGASAAFVNENPAGTFNFIWTVDALTVPGSWTATVSASDSASTTTASFTVCVEVSQITGQVQLEGFVGLARQVTFVAKGGAATKVWTQALNFTGGSANFTLQGIPPGTTTLSAKTAWNLRRRVSTTLDEHGQGVANFTGASLLLGGDLDASNKVSLGDYNQLSITWQSTTSLAGDIDGSGRVSLPDYNILSRNWQTEGDPE